MKNAEFCKLFRHFTVKINKEHYTDARSGCPTNYLAVMLRGNGKVVSDGKTIEMKAGEMFFMPKGLPYQSYWHGESVVSWESVGFDLFPDSENRIFDLQKIRYTESEFELWKKIAEIDKINVASIGVLYTLLSSLIPKMTYKAAKHGSVALQTALSIMENEPNITVPEIAEKCNISVSGLYSVFRHELNRTPVQHKHVILAKKAEELLHNTDYDIEKISEMLGFSSSSYFRKVLYSASGKTPSQIRKERFIM